MEMKRRVELTSPEAEAASGETRRLGKADHLITFKDEQWALWQCVGLRGTGFPATDVIKLKSLEVVAAADRILQTGAEIELKSIEALKAINQALDRLRSEGAWDDLERRTPLIKA